ncbi:MAG: tetratricopeptide repeat protein [Vicinamibacteria bacterium]
MTPPRAIAAFPLVALLSACGPVAERPATPPSIRPSAASTTDPEVAVANLNSQIDRLQAAIAAGEVPSRARRTELVDLLIMRGQFLGKIADYEAAMRLAEQTLALDPNNPAAWIARAKARETFHEFHSALADLDRAATLGASENARMARAPIFQAMGRYEEALAIRAPVADLYPTITSVGAIASLLGEQGKSDAADASYVRALGLYRDVSPFPVAWLLHQQGMMWMRAGEFERARRLMQSAIEVLPSYLQAQVHLASVEAALGNADAARGRLRGFAETADDPEAAGVLASLEHLAGATVEARRLHDLAAARYQELLSLHPHAFLDHSAAFLLGPLGDSAKAFHLAKQNIEVRKTPQSWTLMIQAAQAQGDTKTACDAASRALKWGVPTPSGRALSERALAERMARSCGLVDPGAPPLL